METEIFKENRQVKRVLWGLDIVMDNGQCYNNAKDN